MEHSLLFLGTAAYDFSPKLEGECRDRFDNDARRASCALLDGHILIDCGPHLLDSLRIAGIPASAIDTVLFTHLHCDHFQKSSLSALAEGREHPLAVYAHTDAGNTLLEVPGIAFSPLPFETPVGIAAGMTVTALPANHDSGSFPEHLLFESRDGKRFYYATDGGWILNSAYAHLRERGTLSLLVMDGTVGDYEGDYRAGEHNSIPMVRLLLKSFETVKIIDTETKVYITHIAPSLHAPHEQTEKIMSAIGTHTAADGLLVKY